MTYDEAQKILEERQKIERQKLIKNPDQITTLTDDLIQDLFVEYKGRLSLNGLTSLTDKQAESLAEHQGWLLSLDGLTSLTEEQELARAVQEGLKAAEQLSKGKANPQTRSLLLPQVRKGQEAQRRLA